jgi:hypothetical protein
MIPSYSVKKIANQGQSGLLLIGFFISPLWGVNLTHELTFVGSESRSVNSARLIHEALASTWRKPVSFRYCSRFVVSTVHPRREIAKLVATSGELPQRLNQTPVVLNHSGSVWQHRQTSDKKAVRLPEAQNQDTLTTANRRPCGL